MVNHTSFDHIQYIYSTRAGRRGRRENQCQVGVEILIQRHTGSEDLSNRCNGTACVWNDGVNFLFWQQRKCPRWIGNIELRQLEIEGELMAQDLALARNIRAESEMDGRDE